MQAIEFAQSKMSRPVVGDPSGLLSVRLDGTSSKTQEKLDYQQRLIAQLKQQVATLHVHGQRLLLQNKELKRRVDLLQAKLEQESQHARPNERAKEDVVAKEISLSGAEDPAIQVPTSGLESISNAKTRLTAFLSSAIWTWRFVEVSKAVCAAARVQNAIILVRNPATGQLVSSEDRSVGGIGSLFRLPALDQPSSLAKAAADAGTISVVPNPSKDPRYNVSLDIQSSKVEQCCVSSIPILHQSKVIGVLQTLARHRTSMETRDLDVLQSLARACVDPLRMRLENEQRAVDLALQLKSFAGQAGALAFRNRDLPFVASMIELQVKQILGGDAVHLVWLDRSGPEPVLCRANPAAAADAAGADEDMGATQVLQAPLGGLTAECLRSGTEQYVGKARSHVLFDAEADGVEEGWSGSLLLLPVRESEESETGMAVRVLGDAPFALDGLEQQLLAALQGVMAVVLSSAHDVFAAPSAHPAPSSDERHADEQREASTENLSGLQRFCQRVARQMARAVAQRAARVAFYSVDPEQRQVRSVPFPPQQAGQKAVPARHGAYGQGLSGSAAATGREIVVSCSREDRRFDAGMDTGGAAEGDGPSMWVPMADAEGRVCGVAGVLLDAPRQGAGPGDLGFAAEEVAAVQRIARHHAPFFAEIAGSAAVEEERGLWRRVAAEGRRPLASLDFGAGCEAVKAGLSEVLGLGRCQLYVFDAAKQVLRQSSGQGAGKELEVEVNGTHLLGVASRSGEVLALPRARDDRSGRSRHDLPCMPGSAEQALLVVPVVDSGGVPMMAVQAERGHLNFSQLEREMVAELQQSAAYALELLRFTAAAGGGAHAEESLADCLTIESAMRRIISSACRIAKCHHAMVFWPSPEGSMCMYYVEQGLVKMKHFHTTHGIAAACLVSDNVLMLTDARTHQKFHPVMDGTELAIFKARGAKPGSINVIYHPVQDKEARQPKAVLCVRDKKKGLKFNRNDVMALSAFSRRVGVTLCNVEKHEGVLEVARSGEIRTSQSSHLNSIRTMQIEAMRQLSTRVKFNTVIAKMTHTMAALLDVEVCKLHILEEAGKQVRTLGATSMQDKVLEVATTPLSDLVARCAKTNETILFDLDTLPYEGLPAGVHFEVDGIEMVNSLTVPLRAEAGQPFAVLQFMNKREGGFEGSDELVVHMAAAAFETVLDVDLVDRLRFEVGLGSFNGSAEDIAGAILEKAVQLVPADIGQVLLLVEGRTKMQRLAEIANTGERVRKIGFLADMKGGEGEANEVAHSTFDLTQGLAGAVLQTRTTVNIPNIRKDPRFDPAVDLKSEFSGHSSLLSCPLVSAAGQAMGVVQLAKSGMSQFGAKDVQMMHVLSTQAGTLIFNREKHAEAVAEAVSGILQVTGSILRCLEVQPSVDVIVNRIADRAINVVPCENAVLLFKGRDAVWTQLATTDEEVRRVAGKKQNRTVFARERAHREVRIPLTNGIVAEALHSRNAVEVKNALDTRVNWSFEALCVTELRNMLVVPIFRSKQCSGVGLLVLVNKKDFPAFLHDDARRLDSYKEAISPAVHTIGRCRSWKLQDLLDVMRDTHVSSE